MGGVKEKFHRILYPTGVTVIDPKKATALFLILFSTQLTLTTPFSYLPAMVHSFGYSDRDRGYYAGMIASSLFVGRFFGGYFWGWLTDKMGRRPILLISSTLTFIATVAFGFTTNFYWAVSTRFLQGVFNGVIVCGRAAFAEICDDTNQAIGVSLVFAAWNSAIVLGPAVGGFLAEPVKKYPHSFSASSGAFFTKFAYVLPSVLIACILVVSIVLVYFMFEEPSKERSGENDEEKLLASEEEEEFLHMATNDEKEMNLQQVKKAEQKKMSLDAKIDMAESSRCTRCCANVKSWSIIELLSDTLLVLVIIMFGISGFCIIGFSELQSLWLATHNIYGGLTFSTDKIGIALLVPALFAVILQPIIFGRLERKIGGIRTLQITLVILTLSTFFFPYIHYASSNKYLLWTLLVVFGIFRLIADISSRSCIALFINNAVYKDQAGRANGLAFSVQEIMRVASPTMFGSLFAWAINGDKHEVKFPLDFRLPFMVLSMALVVILVLSFILPKRINGPKLVSPGKIK